MPLVVTVLPDRRDSTTGNTTHVPVPEPDPEPEPVSDPPLLFGSTRTTTSKKRIPIVIVAKALTTTDGMD